MLPTRRFSSEPGFDKYDSNQTALAYEFEQGFSLPGGERFSFRQNFRYVRALTDYQSIYPNDYGNPANPYIDPDMRVIGRYAYISKQRSRAFTLDNQGQADVVTGWFSHTLLLGFDASRFTQTGLSGTDFTTPLDLFAPVYGNYTLPATSETPKSTQTQYGFYAQDQIRFGGGWVALGSLRHDLADSMTDGIGGAPGSDQNDDATTFRLGLLYHAGNGLAPYASYAQSFNPVVGLNSDNQPFKPLRGQQYETGIKFQPAGQQSFVTASVYEIREKNRVTNQTTGDANTPFIQVQLGEGRSRGFELEGTGHITHRLDLVASYTYTAAVVSKSGEQDEVGKRIAGIPRQQASLWAHYGFPLFGISGFEAAGGVRYVGDSYDGADVLRTPSVTLLDALLGYERAAWRLSLNASNLLDETYETTCLARGDCFYGARRSVVGSVAWRW
jgi:iron complex outermembrane receptor protein